MRTCSPAGVLLTPTLARRPPWSLRRAPSAQAKGLKPDAATHGAALDACVRNNDKELALRIYRHATQAGVVDNLHVFTGAIAACHVDKDMATAPPPLRIFNEMQR